MNVRAIIKYTGTILFLEGLFMMPAMGIALYYGEANCVYSFAAVAPVLALGGYFLSRQKRGTEGISAREGFVTVALSWIVLSLFGALPFMLSGTIPRFVDALFETVSGFTTTGASILTDVESMPMSLLYWRSFTHWLGGMGVLVFMLAVSPVTKGRGETFHLMRAESPGPSVGKLTPKLRETARILYLIYIVLTVAEIILLCIGGMPLFDSVVNSFATAGTGGFGIKNNSIAYYDSAYLQTVIAVFMTLCGVNFSLFYLLLLKQAKAVFVNEELRLYLGIIIVFTIAIFLNIRPLYGTDTGKALLDSFFQVTSVITTTGFSTTDFNLWPQLSRYLLVLLMICGACAGSTGGGVKVSRILIWWKYLQAQMTTLLRPRSVKPVMMEGHMLQDEVVRGAHAYLSAYILICLLCIFVLSFEGHSMETNVTAMLTAVNNVGPGLDRVGPLGNFAFFSPISKIALTMAMLFGRLEIFPLMLLFAPSTWKRRA